MYLKSLGTGYGVDSQVGITTEPTAVDEDKTYYVYASFQEKIVTAVDTRKRRSDLLNLKATTPTKFDTINQLTAVFEDEDVGVQE